MFTSSGVSCTHEKVFAVSGLNPFRRIGEISMLPVHPDCLWCWMTWFWNSPFGELHTKCSDNLLVIWVRAFPKLCQDDFADVWSQRAELYSTSRKTMTCYIWVINQHNLSLCCFTGFMIHPADCCVWTNTSEASRPYLGQKGRREPDWAHTPPGTTVTQPCWAGRVSTSHHQPC